MTKGTPERIVEVLLILLLLLKRSVSFAWVSPLQCRTSNRHYEISPYNCSYRKKPRKRTNSRVYFEPNRKRIEFMSVPDENMEYGKEDVRTRSPRPIQELLRELKERGIRYEPTATRSELETLLSQEGKISITDHTTNRRKVPIKQLLDQLDERGIKYPPTASRAELEALLVREPSFSLENPATPPKKVPIHSTKATPIETSTPTKTSTRVPIRQLLSELDEKGIMYPPTATRDMLEDLVQQSRTNTPPPTTKPSKVEETVPGVTISKAPDKEMDPKELQRKRRQQKRKMRLEANKTPLNQILEKTSTAKQTAQDLPRRVSKIVSSNSNTPLSSRLSKVAERTVKKARRVTKQAAEWWEEEGVEGKEKNDSNEDNSFIREPDWYYVKKHTEEDRKVDEPIDVTADVMDVEEQVKQVERMQRRPSPPRRRSRPPDAIPRQGSWDPNSPRQRSPRQQSQRQQGRVFVASQHRQQQQQQARLQLPSMSQDTVSFPKNLNGKEPRDTNHGPTESHGHVAKEPPLPRKKRRIAEKSEKRKRIYSPYGEIETETDGLDRFGEAIANAAETVLWGPEDVASGPTRTPADKSKKPHHWKDRLSKRLDSVLGIPNEQQVYDSWERETAFQKRQYENAKHKDDPLFLYKSRYPGKNKKHKKNRKRAYFSQKVSKNRDGEAPFWEEEGNIISFLFGRTTSGNRLTFDDFLDRADGANMMTTMFRSILRSLLLVSSYACRWASVRGAVPQPVVVVGVAGAALSARHHRLWAVGLTLVGMRTLGEMIHGYVYGDQDWEDDYDSDDDDDGDDDDDAKSEATSESDLD